MVVKISQLKAIVAACVERNDHEELAKQLDGVSVQDINTLRTPIHSIATKRAPPRLDVFARCAELGHVACLEVLLPYVKEHDFSYALYTVVDSNNAAMTQWLLEHLYAKNIVVDPGKLLWRAQTVDMVDALAPYCSELDKVLAAEVTENWDIVGCLALHIDQEKCEALLRHPSFEYLYQWYIIHMKPIVEHANILAHVENMGANGGRRKI